jgi:hypothetical protein
MNVSAFAPSSPRAAGGLREWLARRGLRQGDRNRVDALCGLVADGGGSMLRDAVRRLDRAVGVHQHLLVVRVPEVERSLGTALGVSLVALALRLAPRAGPSTTPAGPC